MANERVEKLLKQFEGEDVYGYSHGGDDASSADSDLETDGNNSICGKCMKNTRTPANREAGQDYCDDCQPSDTNESRAQKILKVTEDGLRAVRITYDNGDTVTTDMAAGLSDDEIRDYYKVGRKFNLGSGENDLMAAVHSVEILA